MKSLFKYYLIISFILLSILIISIWFFNQEGDKDKLQELRRYTVKNFEKELEYQQKNLLTFALALSEDAALKKTMLEKNQHQAYELLYEISNKFVKNTDIKQLRLQLISDELEIFAQNWKKTNSVKSLGQFRTDLIKLKSHRRPKVGIETGRRLTFKSTIPMSSGKQTIGYLEVIQFIDEFVDKLREQGIELFVLMDRAYIIEDSLMKDFPLLDKYVIANENYNIKLKKQIETFPWIKLEHLGYYEDDETFFMLKDMLNSEDVVIGKYLIVLPKEIFLAYKESYQNISRITRFSDEDIYNYIHRENSTSGSYRNFEDRELVELLPKLFKNDKQILQEVARVKLQAYSKDELIDIILEKNHKEVKRGIIK